MIADYMRETPQPTREPVTAAECVFFGEIAAKNATARSLAVCYAYLIAQEAMRHARGEPRDAEFWPWINKALNERLSLNTMDKMDRFRRAAWAIHDAAAQRVPRPAKIAS